MFANVRYGSGIGGFTFNQSPAYHPIILKVEMRKQRLSTESQTGMTCQDPLSARARPQGHLPTTQRPLTLYAQQPARRKNTPTHADSTSPSPRQATKSHFQLPGPQKA